MATSKIAVALIGAGAVIVAAVIGAGATLASRPQYEVPIDQSAPPSSPDVEAPASTNPEPAAEPESQDPPTQPNNNVASRIWLADLEPIVKKGLWSDGPATMRGMTYVHALQSSQTGVQGQTVYAQYALNGTYTRLTGSLGIVDGGHSSEKAYFEIIVDGTVVQTAEIAIGGEPAVVDIGVSGARDLTLQVTNISQSAYWANPVFADFVLE